MNVQEDGNILLRIKCVFDCIKFTNDSGIVMLKVRKCGRCNMLSVIICVTVMPRVLHTHRRMTSNQLNSMVPSRRWTQESHTFSVFRLRQRLAMALKQFGNRKCLSFVSDTSSVYFKPCSEWVGKSVILSVSAVIDQMLFCHERATAVCHISNTWW